MLYIQTSGYVRQCVLHLIVASLVFSGVPLVNFDCAHSKQLTVILLINERRNPNVGTSFLPHSWWLGSSAHGTVLFGIVDCYNTNRDALRFQLFRYVDMFLVIVYHVLFRLAERLKLGPTIILPHHPRGLVFCIHVGRYYVPWCISIKVTKYLAQLTDGTCIIAVSQYKSAKGHISSVTKYWIGVFVIVPPLEGKRYP